MVRASYHKRLGDLRSLKNPYRVCRPMTIAQLYCGKVENGEWASALEFVRLK